MVFHLADVQNAVGYVFKNPELLLNAFTHASFSDEKKGEKNNERLEFLGDSVFVAHNADFDYRFLKGAGKDLGYYLTNECEDTLLISRKKLTWLSNHKLNTVCDHFGIEFRHHRALSDAFATAEAFIELSKL